MERKMPVARSPEDDLPDLSDLHQVWHATQPGPLDAVAAQQSAAPRPTAMPWIKSLAGYPAQLTHAEFASLLFVAESAASALANSGDYDAFNSHRTLSLVANARQVWARTAAVRGRAL